MSEDDASQAQEAEEELDASFKVDASSLGDDESDFARALGFGGDDPEPTTEAAPVSEPPADDDDDEDEPSVEAAADPSEEDVDPPDKPEEDEEEAPVAAAAAEEEAPAKNAGADDSTAEKVDADGQDDSDEDEAVAAAAEISDEESWGDSPDDEDAAEADAASDSADDNWEEVHPRPAAEGIQDTLQERADEVLAREDTGGIAFQANTPSATTPVPVDDGALAALNASLDASEGERSALTASLAEREREVETLRVELDAALAAGDTSASEKEAEELRVEVEVVSIERDQLIDQLAATSGQLVQAQRTGEQLAASLRAARGALVPLPEGERALRAEVIGLRGRLDEAAQENHRLATDCASVATELAIAAARVEDRQHEIDFHDERANALEAEVAEKDAQLEQALAKHREVLGLATRLQAENTELRSTQGALEETLQARDLEITAREEHLRVTRDGLTTRDTQLVDLNEAFAQERHRVEALEADIERKAIEHGVLIDKVSRRESRIATLTSTLTRIEDAMGQRIHIPDSNEPVFSRAEWTAVSGATTRARASGSAATMGPTASEDAEVHAPGAGPEPAAIEPAPFVAEDASDEAEPEVSTPAPAIADEATEPALTQASEVEAHAEKEIESVEAPRRLVSPPELPPILSSWRDRRFAEVHEGGATVAEFLAERLHGHLGQGGPETIYLRSLGGSLPDAETRLVSALHARGLDGIRMEVLDADEERAAARRHRIELAGLGETIQVQVGDLDAWNVDAPCHAILLADVLHAQLETEAILDLVSPAVGRGALVLFAGRIGSGPVQLSASTLMRLEEIWQLLPESLASREGLGITPFRGDDGGCPAPAVDAAQALCARFESIVLTGFGHLADLVVGPARGFMLSEEEDEALDLIESILAIDESRGLTESLPPRHGVAVFAHGSASRTEVFGQEWPEAE